MSLIFSKVGALLPRVDVLQSVVKLNLGSLFHTSAVLARDGPYLKGPRKFEQYNKQIFPIQKPDEEPRPAYVCLVKQNIRYSPKKMWYISTFVRGMSVDEALKQLSFVLKKGATAIKEAILEAQELAVKRHNVEYKTNLWVAESFCTKGAVYKGIRRHARMRRGIVHYRHSHYFLRLEEGTPPENYYLPNRTPKEQLDDWMASMRKRKIYNSL